VEAEQPLATITTYFNVVWSGCGDLAVYMMRKHGVLADKAVTEPVALLNYLFLFSAAESAHAAVAILSIN